MLVAGRRTRAALSWRLLPSLCLGGVIACLLAGTCVKGHEVLPGGGHESCPVVATRSARSWPPDVPGLLGQGDHPFAGHGLGEPDAVAAGLADVGVVE